MAEQKSSSGGHGGLYFIVGILVAAVTVLAVLYLNGTFSGSGKDINVKIEAPKTDGAPKK